MKVIVADDSSVMRLIIAKVLLAMGHQIFHAINGLEVMERLKNDYREIDLVLLDWNMPVMDGMEVVKAMQKDSNYRRIPIVMVSTESEKPHIEMAMRFGVRGYITKPFTPQDLTGKINQTLAECYKSKSKTSYATVSVSGV